MNHEVRLSKALADGAEMLVKAIEQCNASAQECMDIAWTKVDVITAGRSTQMAQTHDFIRLAGEIGTALSKLKGQVHHQHIAVERIDPARATASAILLEQSAAHVSDSAAASDASVPAEETCAMCATGTADETPLDAALDPGERGEGEGYDKQLDVVEAEHAPAS
jgi:hypothetical protein